MVMADMMDGYQQVPAGGVSRRRRRRAVRPRRRPRHRRPQGRPGVAHRRRRLERPHRRRHPPAPRRRRGPGRRASGGTLIADATRRALASGRGRPDQVVAVSCTGQWASTVPVDEDGRAGRRLRACGWTAGARPHARRAVGGPVSGYAPAAPCGAGSAAAAAPRRPRGPTRSATCCYLEHDEPEVAERARWYLEPVDYLSMRFTGVAAATPRVDDRPRGSPTTAPRPPRLRPRPGGAGPASPADKLPPLVRHRLGGGRGARRGRRRARPPRRRRRW